VLARLRLMTILIAVALHDTVLMLADGRRSDQHNVITDQSEKIFPLKGKISLAICGAEIGTDFALEKLRPSTAQTASALCSQLARLSLEGTSHVLRQITPETRSDAFVRVGLLAGGFENAQAFLVAGLFGTGMDSPSSVNVSAVKGAPQYIVIGGEEVGAQAVFGERLKQVIECMGDSGAEKPAVRSAILAIGNETILSVAEHDARVGGMVQFRTLRHGQPDEVGTFPQRNTRVTSHLLI